MLRQVEAVQRSGFTYICVGQHFLYGGYTYLQPVPMLARIAAEVDRHVRLVTSILISPLYHPVMLAEELATLDIMTEGRLIIGLGLGYRKQEFDYLGIPFAERIRRFEKGLALMRQIWSGRSVTYRDEFWTVEDGDPHILTWQHPHPPIWLGGHSEPAVRRAGRVADGWIAPPAVELAEVQRLHELFAEEQMRRGQPRSLQPLRRNVFLGRDRQDALEKFMRSSIDRYLYYANSEHEVWHRGDVENHFTEVVGDHMIAGNVDAILAEINHIARTVAVDPMLLRAGWPDMDPDWFISYVDEMGRELVPAIREIPAMAAVAYHGSSGDSEDDRQ